MSGMANPLAFDRAARFDGRLVWWEHGGRWIVGAEDCPNGEPSRTGGIYAWLDAEPDPSELMAILRGLGGDLDRASDRWVERYGGHSGYRPARFPADVRQVVA
jgi:hypothetical protein